MILRDDPRIRDLLDILIYEANNSERFGAEGNSAARLWTYEQTASERTATLTSSPIDDATADTYRAIFNGIVSPMAPVNCFSITANSVPNSSLLKLEIYVTSDLLQMIQREPLNNRFRDWLRLQFPNLGILEDTEYLQVSIFYNRFRPNEGQHYFISRNNQGTISHSFVWCFHDFSILKQRFEASRTDNADASSYHTDAPSSQSSYPASNVDSEDEYHTDVGSSIFGDPIDDASASRSGSVSPASSIHEEDAVAPLPNIEQRVAPIYYSPEQAPMVDKALALAQACIKMGYDRLRREREALPFDRLSGLKPENWMLERITERYIVFITDKILADDLIVLPDHLAGDSLSLLSSDIPVNIRDKIQIDEIGVLDDTFIDGSMFTLSISIDLLSTIHMAPLDDQARNAIEEISFVGRPRFGEGFSLDIPEANITYFLSRTIDGLVLDAQNMGRTHYLRLREELVEPVLTLPSGQTCPVSQVLELCARLERDLDFLREHLPPPPEFNSHPAPGQLG